MSIKAGQIIHDAQGFVVDRIHTVATIRDIPDLSFDLESLDVSTEIEALNVGLNPTTVSNGQQIDFTNSKPLDVISPFKSGQGAYDIVKGIVLPYLTLESLTYRFGTRQNATQQMTLRGDSVYYVPGTPYYEQFSGNGVTTVFTFAHTAIVFRESGDDIYALGICVNHADGTYQRLFHGVDFTDTSAGFTLASATLAPAGSTIKVVYGSTVAANYPQTVHQGAAVKPAAVRGKDIDVYVGTDDATPIFSRWSGVQSFEVTRRVNLDNDEEFGNPHYVAQDYDTADVNGSVVVRPRNPADLWDKIHQIADVPSNEIVGPYTSVTLPVELRINHPDTGVRVKTLYVPDARFTIPSVQGRVQQKAEVTFNFSSDEGLLLAFVGARA
jgi:hypothetical protein